MVDSVHEPAAIPSLKLPHRPSGPAGFVLSLLLHTALVILVVLPWARDLARFERAFGPAAGASGGGGGGGGVRELALPAYEAPRPAPEAVAETEAVVPPPEPEPVPEVAPVVVVARPDSQRAAVASAGPPAGAPGVGPGAGGGSGGGTGGGVGSGTGAGSGPGTGTGDGGRARPPQLRHFAIWPDGAPDALKGRTVNVTFYVEPNGSVRTVDVTPPIEDRGYARKATERLLGYRFRPALDPSGLAVPGRVTIQFELPTR
jgi:protein TonB